MLSHMLSVMALIEFAAGSGELSGALPRSGVSDRDSSITLTAATGRARDIYAGIYAQACGGAPSNLGQGAPPILRSTVNHVVGASRHPGDPTQPVLVSGPEISTLNGNHKPILQAAFKVLRGERERDDRLMVNPGSEGDFDLTYERDAGNNRVKAKAPVFMVASGRVQVEPSISPLNGQAPVAEAVSSPFNTATPARTSASDILIKHFSDVLVADRDGRDVEVRKFNSAAHNFIVNVAGATSSARANAISLAMSKGGVPSQLERGVLYHAGMHHFMNVPDAGAGAAGMEATEAVGASAQPSSAATSSSAVSATEAATADGVSTVADPPSTIGSAVGATDVATNGVSAQPSGAAQPHSTGAVVAAEASTHGGAAAQSSVAQPVSTNRQSARRGEEGVSVAEMIVPVGGGSVGSVATVSHGRVSLKPPTVAHGRVSLKLPTAAHGRVSLGLPRPLAAPNDR